MSENNDSIVEMDDGDDQPTRDRCNEAVAQLIDFVDQIVYRPDSTATHGILLSERWKFDGRDYRVEKLARQLGVQDALPDIERLSRFLDVKEPRTQFLGNCNVPGDEVDGVFVTVTEPHWLDEMRNLRRRMEEAIEAEMPLSPLPPNGAKVKADDVPAECRELGQPNGHVLDAPYLAGSIAWDIMSIDLNRAFDDDQLTYRIKVGRAFAYRYDELLVLKKKREARKKS